MQVGGSLSIFTSEKLQEYLISCEIFHKLAFWYHLLLKEYFHEMSQFKHVICFQCSILNKIWVYDICKSVESFFLIYILHSVLNFFWKWVCKKQIVKDSDKLNMQNSC